MLTAFKDFGKAATDLNKKEFYDDKTGGKKATVKTKSADGVTFEGFVTGANKSELNLNFKDKELELKNKINEKAQYTVDATLFAVADGVDATAVFVTPDKSGKEAFFDSISLGAKYNTADLNGSGDCKISFAKDGMFKYSGFELNGAASFQATGDLTVGAGCNGFSMNTEGEGDKAKAIMSARELKIGSIFKAGDISVCAGVNASFQGKEDYGFVPGGLTASIFQKATPETSIAAEFGFARGNVEDGTMKGFVDKNQDLSVSVKLGSAYTLSDCATLKSKLTLGANAPALDFAWVQKLGKGTATFSQRLSEGSAFTSGISYTLDC
jgi:hypothetical protein